MMQGSLARNLRVLRAERGLNLTEASKLSGVTIDTISTLEHGERGAYTSTLYKLAEAYGVTLGDLMGEASLVTVGKAEAPKTRQRGSYEPLMPRPEVQEWLSEQGHETFEEFRSTVEELETLEEVEQARHELREKRDGLVDELSDRSVQVELFGPVRPRDFEGKKAREREALRPANLVVKLKQEIRHEYGAREDALAEYSSVLFVEGKADDYLVREPVGERDRERHERLLEARRAFEKTYAALSAAV